MAVAFAALILSVVLIVNSDVSISLADEPADTSSPNATCQFFDRLKVEHGVVTVMPSDYYSNLKQVLHVKCNPGYDLFGPPKILCIDGSWIIEQTPQCIARCHGPPPLLNGHVDIDLEIGHDGKYTKGTVATYSCHDNYQLRPADGQYRVCEKGIWTGTNVSCVLIVKNGRCKPLKDIENGYFLRERVTEQETTFIGHYYCKGGYTLKGESELHCLPNGTWYPRTLPQCVISYPTNCFLPEIFPHATSQIVVGNRYDDMVVSGTEVEYNCLPKYRNAKYPCEPARLRCIDGKWMGTPPNCIETNDTEPIIFSLATGAAVLLVLVIACLVIVCRKRKPLTRTVTIPPPVPRTADLTDHASLLHPPDRLALIAFADGMQVGQSGLPTYEEATSGGGTGSSRLGVLAARMQRPPWPSLACRRSRNSPNPDGMLFNRQGSFASRSGGDPMGSTDTMAVSENSTTVTLDTASSHSGSQPASCRAHCGSLASFDTSSVLNTEGVPLLEESELEEVQCGETVSLAMENRSMCDSSSYKLSTASDIA